jgi:hypothetical protein
MKSEALEATDDEDRDLMMANALAIEAIAELTKLHPPAELRRRAALVIRCDDCAGRAVAWVAWIRGHPLFVGEHGQGKVMISLLDEDVFAAPTFRCRRASWRLLSLDDLPGPGAAPATRRVTHSDANDVP